MNSLTCNLADDVEFTTRLLDFITPVNQLPKAKWIDGQFLKLYVRNGPRYIDGQKLNVITVANVEVYARGYGLYSQLLRLIEDTATTVYIECVHDRAHDGIYTRRGYVEFQNDDLSLSKNFIKYIDPMAK